MSMNPIYMTTEPSRDEIDALRGPVLLEFGAGWCGHCQAVQPLLSEALVDYGYIQHIKIHDGSGRPLGRSFNVKLWPTLIFLRDGREVARLVRPRDVNAIRQALHMVELVA
jgi:thioredoxin 1